MADKEPFSHAAAIVELKRGLNSYRAFEHANEVIQVLADYDKTLAELQHRISTSKNDYEANMARYRQELKETAEAVAKAKQDAADAADRDRKESTDLIAAARIEARGIIENAQRKQAAAEAGAADADSRRQQFEEVIAAKRQELLDLKARIQEAKDHATKILGA